YLSDTLAEKYRGSAKPHDRLTASPLRPERIAHVDLLLVTHKHSDHFDPGTVPAMLRSSPRTRLVLPRALMDHARSMGLDDARIVCVDADQPIKLNGVRIRPIPAAHERLDRDAQGNYLCLGYIIEIAQTRLYHSGDTIPYPGLVERLAAEPVDVAFLPINGRDAGRHALGTPGNCTIEESLCLAALAGVRTLVPHHYDMFAFNTASIAAFRSRAAELFPDLLIRVLQPGEQAILPGRKSDNGCSES
ncbi:MAG TPA: MBL fold metallo-hydrolase, partial [Tepidisphaeraceae bacterium]|nr:MBL fold metallo-hydrolase [Tepidisphaeraceae bacterium]